MTDESLLALTGPWRDRARQVAGHYSPGVRDVWIGGPLCINVGGIPLEGSAWGFALTCVVMVSIAVGRLLLFKKMKWL